MGPFVFLLWRESKFLWRRHWSVLAPFLVFLTAHMIVKHKEERFLYPILALEFWFIAYLWSAAAARKWARRIYAPVLLGVSALALPIALFVNTQEGEIGPPALVEGRYREVLFLDYKSLFGVSRSRAFFLRPPSALEKIELTDFAAHRVDRSLSDHGRVKAVAFVTSDREGFERMRLIEGVSTVEGHCLNIEESGSFMDKLLFKMNPKHNQRRRPTWFLVCERAKSG
jgi:hypothetical protein